MERFRALGSPCEVKLEGPSRARLEAVARACIDELERIEVKYSRYRDDTIVTEINRSAGKGQWVEVDDETSKLLDYAATAFRESRGLFDITSGVLRRVWDFKSGRIPEKKEIESVRKLIGWKKVRWKSSRIQLPLSGMEIDFGGFGKEYAADRLAELCREQGIQHGLVDLGGDICVIGPHSDGSPWKIGIRDPYCSDQALASLPLSHGSMATSGNYERFLEIDGKRHSHLLDPRSGWPVHGLAAATVVASHCLVAGTATTVAMLNGSRGPRWLAELGLPHLWIDDEGRRGGSLWPSDSQSPSAAPQGPSGS